MKLYFKSTTLDKKIAWTWVDMDKAYWLSWIPKKSDIKIVTRLNKEQKKEFIQLCKDDDTSASREIRHFIKKFISDTKSLNK